MILRRAAVAGRFYPGRPIDLEETLSRCIPADGPREDALGVVVPHAGYMYSGGVAGATYAKVLLPRKFILLCPNHTGMGAPISIMSVGEWETPLGRVPIESDLACCIRRSAGIVQESPEAHRSEHALEVHLPFLQHLLGNEFQFVPISVGTSRYDWLVELGDALERAVRKSAEPVLLIASTDMNHFEPADQSEAKDRLAIDRIREMDAQGLYQVVREKNISMCGYGPTVAVLSACRRMGASSADLVQYTHSGNITGDRSSVVGYAGLVIRRPG